MKFAFDNLLYSAARHGAAANPAL